MADELKYSISTRYRAGNVKDDTPGETFSITQSNLEEINVLVVSVGTSEEDLVLTGLTTEGFVLLRNLDDTNYVTFGPKSGGAMVAFGRIEPGEEHLFRFEPGVVLRWIADTASVNVLVKAFGD